jgi:hypothetical protein
VSWETGWLGRKKRLGGEAIGAPVREGNTHRSGLLDGGDECCLKFSKLRTGFSWKPNRGLTQKPNCATDET